MSQRIKRLAAVTVAFVAVMLASAGAQDRDLLRRDAERLVALPYWAFAREAAARRSPFDWSTDGCSRTPRVFAARFAGPCRQHDFAYRNLGHGLRLDASESTRRWADDRFHDELRRRCTESVSRRRRARCNSVARAMWAAVRRFGTAWGSASRSGRPATGPLRTGSAMQSPAAPLPATARNRRGCAVDVRLSQSGSPGASSRSS